MTTSIGPVDPSLMVESLKRLELIATQSKEDMGYFMVKFPRDCNAMIETAEKAMDEMDAERNVLVEYLIKYLAQTGVLSWPAADELHKSLGY